MLLSIPLDEYPYETAKEDSMILNDPAPETGEENGNDVAADPDHADDKREQEEQQTGMIIGNIRLLPLASLGRDDVEIMSN